MSWEKTSPRRQISYLLLVSPLLGEGWGEAPLRFKIYVQSYLFWFYCCKSTEKWKKSIHLTRFSLKRKVFRWFYFENVGKYNCFLYLCTDLTQSYSGRMGHNNLMESCGWVYRISSLREWKGGFAKGEKTFSNVTCLGLQTSQPWIFSQRWCNEASA